MNQNMSTIKEKRTQLGWTLKVLAEKTNISYSTLLRIEKGDITGMDDYISLIEVTLNKALDLPYKKWSYKYDRCEKCGTTQTKHISRGLCKNCYDKDIEKRHKDGNRIRNHGGSSAILTKEYLEENYIKDTKSLGEIAKDTNCSRQYVYKKMKSYGISPRDQSSAREIALDKGKIIRENVSYEGKQQFVTLEKVDLNEGFFSSWSPGMAYVLGIIYTDGNLLAGKVTDPSKKSNVTVDRVSLSQKEPELLNKVLALMDCNAVIHLRKERKYIGVTAGQIYWFSIANKKIYDTLLRLGLTPHKSLIMSFPDIPKEYMGHFIRGCWDGDGSIYLEKSNLLRAHFVSGSYKFIKRLVEELYTAGIYQTRYIVSNNKESEFRSEYPWRQFPLKIHENKHSKSYYIRIASKEGLERLFAYFYKDVDESMYLERKYKIFKEGLAIKTS